MPHAEPVAAVPTDAALIAAWQGGGETAGRPRAAVADAARGILAAGPAGARVRRDRGGPGDFARRRARALPPRGQTVEGVSVLNRDELPDARLQELAQRLGVRAAE